MTCWVVLRIIEEWDLGNHVCGSLYNPGMIIYFGEVNLSPCCNRVLTRSTITHTVGQCSRADFFEMHIHGWRHIVVANPDIAPTDMRGSCIS